MSVDSVGPGQRGRPDRNVSVSRELAKIAPTDRPHLDSTCRSVLNGGGLFGEVEPPEFYCQSCGSRITASPNGNREYGHVFKTTGGAVEQGPCPVLYGDRGGRE